jgi:basic membrane protein A
MRPVSGVSRPESSLGGNARKCEARLQPLSSTRFGNAGDACEGGHSLATKVEVNLRNNATSLSLAALFAAAALAATTAPASAFLACAVTDVGGVDDKGFNQYTWQGVQDAAKEGGFEAKLLESKAETDYVPNINSFISGGCNVIVTVGFLLGDATKTAAEANSGIDFTIVDFAYDPTIPNVLGQVYATNQAAFLAGYAAAGMTKTGTVGTFGGINIGPPVTDFMDGFVWGVDYYNKQKSKSVKVLGWDPAKKEGLFTGNFDSLDDGKAFAKNLNDEGADIVMPVAGKVGQGSAALAAELGPDALKIIGVDTDQYDTDPDHKGIFLTSVLKQVNATTKEAVTEAFKGSFKGGVIVGTLESGGVGLAPFHDFDSAVPDDLKAELDTIKAGIIDGSIKVGG